MSSEYFYESHPQVSRLVMDWDNIQTNKQNSIFEPWLERQEIFLILLYLLRTAMTFIFSKTQEQF